MLSPFDDFPIHPSADPIAHPATGDPNHYDRYFFNGHSNDGTLYFAAAMGHYPVRGVIDAAFSVVLDGVEHSVFSSGRMPLDRSTVIGPVRIEVLEPMAAIRYVVEPNETGIECGLTFVARTVAVEEPRQRTVSPQGILTMDHTRLTQWGSWQGRIVVDGEETRVEAAQVPGTRDRSWGTRPNGLQPATNWEGQVPQAFWLWAPLHFGDRYTHLALHERSDGTRWLETAVVLDPIPAGAEPWSTAGVRECHGINYELEFEPGERLVRKARLSFDDPEQGATTIELETVLTFRMRGIGYFHPQWGHGSNHGELEVGRESIPLKDFEALDSIHVQNLVVAQMGGQRGIGVLEQAFVGPHAPTGLTGLFDGHSA